MNRFKAHSIFFVALLLLMSCGLIFEHKFKTYTTSFSEIPLPLSEFNTIFDDYNSALHEVGDFFPLVFSTNRGSEGRQYDFIVKFLGINFQYTRNILTIGEGNSATSETLYRLVNTVNNDADQLGPCIIPGAYNQKEHYQSYIFLYSSNEEGSQDIRFTHNLTTKDYNPTKTVAFLNSTADDAYPIITQDSSSLYFCSNRSGNFDIYSVALNTN